MGENINTARRAAIDEVSSPYPFEPYGEGVSVAANSSSAVVALPKLGERALVSNYGANAAFLSFGDATAVATTASLCALPGIQMIITVPLLPGNREQCTHVAVVSPSGTNVQISLGSGA